MPTESVHASRTILNRRDLGAGLVELTVEWTGPVARPGQFAMLRGPWGDAPLLPRAISFCDCTAETATFLFRVHGSGTRLLARLSAGENLSVTGPLGNAFPVIPCAWLAAGGIGLPPLWFHQRRHGGRLFWGVPSRAAAAGLQQEGWELASDDGTLGFHGTVVRLLERELEASPPPAVLACGPYPMLSALKALCQRCRVPLHVSLEGKMACGAGVCCGCAHPAMDGGYVHVCEQGPVFDAEKVRL